MTVDCTQMAVTTGHILDTATSPPTQTAISIHYEYGIDGDGARILVATRYTDAAGVPQTLTATQTAIAGPVQPVGVDVEWQLLGDDTDGDPSTPAVPFLRKYTRISNGVTGAVISETADDFEVDMVTPYEVEGTVVAGAADDTEVSESVLCDGTSTSFIRRTTLINGTVVTVGDFELDGETAFVPTGTVGPCPNCAPAVAQGVVSTWG